MKLELGFGTWFPSFNSLSFLKKIDIGISSTSLSFFMSINVFLIIFMCLVIFRHLQLGFNTLIIFDVFLIMFNISFYLSTLGSQFTIFKKFSQLINKNGSPASLLHPKSWIVIGVLLFVVIGFIILVTYCFEGFYNRVQVLILLCIAFASRFILGFSPTVWGSGERTSILIYIVLYILFIVILNKLGNSNNHLMNFKRGVLAYGILEFLITLSIIGLRN